MSDRQHIQRPGRLRTIVRVVYCTLAAATFSACESSSPSSRTGYNDGFSEFVTGMFDGLSREYGSAGACDTLSTRDDLYPRR